MFLIFLIIFGDNSKDKIFIFIVDKKINIFYQEHKYK